MSKNDWVYNLTMPMNRKEIIELVNKFTNECDKNDIWYSLDQMSILGAVRHGGFVPWHERFEIFVTVDAYNKLKRLYPKNIIDSGVDVEYKCLTAAWVNDNSKWQAEQPFIRIRVLVPTTLKKLRKYKSPIGAALRALTFRRDNIKRAINDLHEPKLYQGYYFVDSRRSSAVENWIQVVSGERVDLEFNGHKYKVFKEYKDLLVLWYGDDYMDAKAPESWNEYPGPFIVKKVK